MISDGELPAIEKKSMGAGGFAFYFRMYLWNRKDGSASIRGALAKPNAAWYSRIPSISPWEPLEHQMMFHLWKTRRQHRIDP